jgi:hypothetical protein
MPRSRRSIGSCFSLDWPGEEGFVPASAGARGLAGDGVQDCLVFQCDKDGGESGIHGHWCDGEMRVPGTVLPRRVYKLQAEYLLFKKQLFAQRNLRKLFRIGGSWLDTISISCWNWRVCSEADRRRCDHSRVQRDVACV